MRSSRAMSMLSLQKILWTWVRAQQMSLANCVAVTPCCRITSLICCPMCMKKAWNMFNLPNTGFPRPLQQQVIPRQNTLAFRNGFLLKCLKRDFVEISVQEFVSEKLFYRIMCLFVVLLFSLYYCWLLIISSLRAIHRHSTIPSSRNTKRSKESSSRHVCPK